MGKSNGWGKVLDALELGKSNGCFSPVQKGKSNGCFSGKHWGKVMDAFEFIWGKVMDAFEFIYIVEPKS